MDTKRLGIVGRDIQYTLSPWIHSEFGQLTGVPLKYTIEEVEAGMSFQDKIQAIRHAGFWGCNITVPYKEEAFKIAHEITERAEEAGAANTFLFHSGRIIADNTDGIGLVRDLTCRLAYRLEGKRILICGAGGAVRGILGPLIAACPQVIIIANRSLERGQEVVKRFSNPRVPVEAVPYEALRDQSFDLILDGTSLKTDHLPLPSTLSLSEQGLVYDLKYDLASDTPIMRWGREQGGLVSDGLGMLIEQAAESFRFWVDMTPNTRLIFEMMRPKG